MKPSLKARRVVLSPFILLIWIYQKVISPILPPSCIYTPTCSEYAKEALLKHGLIKGIMMAGLRIGRCQPFCRGGHDPVPDTFTWKRNE